VLEIFGGSEPRTEIGYHIASASAIARSSRRLRIEPISEHILRAEGLYWRPHEERNGQLWDVISDAPMSTSFACSRFLVPFLANERWALWCDFTDMMFIGDPAEILDLADDRFAVMVVKHQHVPSENVKMDAQIQTAYARKNWSSLILWNWQHHANDGLTINMVNSLPGRDLHRFCWLKDEEIGELPPEWNYLVGITPMTVKPKLLHFTEGIPVFPGYDAGRWADVWLRELAMLDATRARIPVNAA
jgi:hypothetical protein